MANRYKLRTAIHGHEKDVRGLCPAYFPQDSLLSASRDVTARLWRPNEDGTNGFEEAHVMSGHNNFVSCICVMPPDEKYPHGLIMTGSADKMIFGYTLESATPLFKLEGHTNNVCSLAAGKFGSLISGSWDMTAKVWLNQKCVMTLAAHEAAVWAVAIMPEGGYMLTGSADKLIKLWRAGKCHQTFAGHTDCVRALAVLSASEFLSSSNDMTIKRWLTTGECTFTYSGHSSFVYSLAVLPNGEDFISSGEDRSLRVWTGGNCVQTIPHPTESVWAVCALPNGDIVSGASDGMIRIFTTAPERMADEDVQLAYEEEVAASSIPAQIGDISTEQLSGPEALLNPGKRDGQTMMIKRDNKVEAHQWNAADGRWVKIGDVTGGEAEIGEGAGGKKTYKGKEYDYVFDVELDENRPGLKLPYNNGQDPWMASHTFLQDNDLSPMFLDQVAKFIMSQTKQVTLGPVSNEFKDPFSEVRDTTVQYYPKTTYLGFDQANALAILGKVREFNSKVSEGERVNENVIDSLEHLMTGQGPSAMQLDTLWKALQWPQDVVFPAVDVLRLAIRHQPVSAHFCSSSEGGGFLRHLLGFLQPSSPAPVQLLTVRVLCNMYRQSPGEVLLSDDQARAELLQAITSLITTAAASKHLQVAVATFMLNSSVAAHTKNSPNEVKVQLIATLATLAPGITDPEASFRMLVAIGTLSSTDRNARELVKSASGLIKYIGTCRKIMEPVKVADCAKQLTDYLLQ